MAWLIGLLALVVGLAGNAAPRAMSAHEIFAAQTAREMIQSGDWVHPTYNAVSRLKKPPLMYWLQAGVSEIAGYGDDMPTWIARLPSALAGALLVVMAGYLGRRVYGASTGITAAMLVAGCVGFVEFTRNARPDMVYAACCSLVLLGFVSAALPDRAPRVRFWDAMIGWAGFGLATMAKGPHVPAIILLGIAAHMFAAGRRRDILGSIKPVRGIALVVAIAAPWIVAVMFREDEAAGVWLQQLFAGRGEESAGSWLAWLSPYYLYAVPKLILPWAILLPFGIFVSLAKGDQMHARGRVLLWIVGVSVVVMSVSDHRRDYYMLPLLAPLGVLMAHGTADWLSRMLTKRGWRKRIVLTLAAVCVGLSAVLIGRSVMAPELPGRVLEIGGGVACVALVIATWRHGIDSLLGAHGLIRLAAAIPMVIGIALAADPMVRDAYTQKTHQFALRVRETVGESGRLYFYRMPDAGLHFAQVVYTMSCPIPEAVSADELASLAGESGFWVALRMDDAPELAERWEFALETDMASDDKGEPRIGLIRVTKLK